MADLELKYLSCHTSAVLSLYTFSLTYFQYKLWVSVIIFHFVRLFIKKSLTTSDVFWLILKTVNLNQVLLIINNYPRCACTVYVNLQYKLNLIDFKCFL